MSVVAAARSAAGMGGAAQQAGDRGGPRSRTRTPRRGRSRSRPAPSGANASTPSDSATARFQPAAARPPARSPRRRDGIAGMAAASSTPSDAARSAPGRAGAGARARSASGGAIALIRRNCATRQIEDDDTAVLDPEHPGVGECLQRLVHPLARHAREVADLLLREREVRARTGVEIGVVHRRQAACDAGVDVEQPVVLDLADELAQPFVELEEQEPVERDARVEQPFEHHARHHRDPGLAQCDHVVPARLALQQRAFPEPGAGRQAGERRELAGPGQTRHLDQALDDADPVRDRLSLPANVMPGRHAALDRRGEDAVDPIGRKRLRPEASPEHRFERVDRARRRRLSAG